MATDTKNQDTGYEGAPWDQEEEEVNTNVNNLQSPVDEHDTDDFTNNDDTHDEGLSQGGEGKENLNQMNRSNTTTPSATEEPTKPAKKAGGSRSGSRVRSRSRPQSAQRPAAASRNNSDNGAADKPNTTTATSPTRHKSQPLPSVWEDNNAEKGQLVKRNRRRNKKSGYESSATEEIPLRERQRPPQQQIQPQQEAAPPKKNDPMKLRLDLNLEIEVELKARIHGDLTLALFS